MAENLFYSNFEILLKFTTDIINFSNEKGEKTEITPEILSAGSMYIQFLDRKSIIKGFIKRSLKYWDKIKNKDEEFLINNCSVLFNELDEKYIDDFSRLFTLKKNGEYFLPQGTRDSLWEILTEMIICCIKYIHQERCFKVFDPPKFVESTQKYIEKGYTKSFFPEIKLSTEVKRFEVEI
jgi:hypothetical protein